MTPFPHLRLFVLITVLPVSSVSPTPAAEVLWTRNFQLGLPDTSVLLADVTGAPGPELVFTTTSGNVVVCDLDGNLQWVAEGYDVFCNPPTPADLFPETGSEVLAVDRKGLLVCLSSDGDELWRRRLPGGMDWNQTTIVAVDLERNGDAEILIGDKEGHFFCLDRLGREKWSFLVPGGFHCPPAVGDLNRDGTAEIVITSGDENLLALTSAGTPAWITPLGSDNISGPVIADMDQDGEVEILVGGSDGVLKCFDNDGRPVWKKRLGSKEIDSTISVGNVLGDAKREIFCVDLQGYCYCLNSAGEVLWKINLGNRSRRPPSLADFNGDGNIEILVTGYISHFVLVSAEGKILEKTPGGETNGGPVLFPYKNRLAAVIPSMGKLYCLTWQKEPGSTIPRILWGTYRFDPGQTACVRGKTDPSFGVPAPAHPDTDEEMKELAGNLEEWRTRLVGMSDDLAGLRTRLREKGAVVPELGELELDLKDLSNRLEDFFQGPSHRSVEAGLKLRRRLEQIGENFRHSRKTSHRILAFLENRSVGRGTQALVAWKANPWWDVRTPAEELDEYFTSRQIDVFLYRNEIESAAVNLFNAGNRPLTVRVLIPDGEVSEPSPRVEAFEVLSVPTELGDYADDALSPLNRSRTIHLGAGETRQIFLRIHAGECPAGVYESEIQLKPVTVVSEPVRISLKTEVADLDIRDGTPPWLCTWGYVHSSFLKGFPENAWKDRREHGNNVLNITSNFLPKAEYDAEGNLTTDLDFNALGEFLDSQPGDLFLLFNYGGVLKGPKGDQPFSETHNKAFKAWLAQIVRFLKERGIGYDRFALYPVDEPGLRPGLVDLYLNYARQARQADPNVLMYTDPVDGADMNDIRRMADYVDIWCPNRNGFLLDAEEPRLDVMKSNGRMVWTYECQHHAKHRPPLEYYRGLAWLAEWRGLSGFGFWTYCTTRDDPWGFPVKGGHDYALVYPGDGVITSRRWEAVREGVEDIRAVSLLKKKLVEQERRSKTSALIRGARRVLQEAVEELGSFCLEPNGTGDIAFVGTDWLTPERVDKEWQAYLRHRRAIAEQTLALQPGEER